MKDFRFMVFVTVAVGMMACSTQSDFNQSVFSQYNYHALGGAKYDPQADYDF